MRIAYEHMDSINVGLLGFGNVGTGTYETLTVSPLQSELRSTSSRSLSMTSTKRERSMYRSVNIHPM